MFLSCRRGAGSEFKDAAAPTRTAKETPLSKFRPALLGRDETRKIRMKLARSPGVQSCRYAAAQVEGGPAALFSGEGVPYSRAQAFSIEGAITIISRATGGSLRSRLSQPASRAARLDRGAGRVCSRNPVAPETALLLKPRGRSARPKRRPAPVATRRRSAAPARRGAASSDPWGDRLRANS